MDKNCIFCKIVAKEIPAEIVYEDADFLALMDINPRSPGHVQVIPKNHHRWVWDVPNVGEYFEIVKKIALAQQKAFNEKEIWVRICGNEVAHAHVWVFPTPEKTSGNKMDLKVNAEKIRNNL